MEEYNHLFFKEVLFSTNCSHFRLIIHPIRHKSSDTVFGRKDNAAGGRLYHY